MKESREAERLERRHERRIDLAVGWLCMLGGLLTVVAGRYMTAAQTEAYALVDGWIYWVIGGALLVAGYFLIKERND